MNDSELKPDADYPNDMFEGYPRWKKDERINHLRNCFLMIPLQTLLAISGQDAVVKVAAALYCQASMEGRKVRIFPYAAWREVLGLPKRSYFRAIATLESHGLIRRHPRGPGRKATVELLGPLAQFVARPGPNPKTAQFSQKDDKTAAV